jgi:hypothetical protein
MVRTVVGTDLAAIDREPPALPLAEVLVDCVTYWVCYFVSSGCECPARLAGAVE